MREEALGEDERLAAAGAGGERDRGVARVASAFGAVRAVRVVGMGSGQWAGSRRLRLRVRDPCVFAEAADLGDAADGVEVAAAGAVVVAAVDGEVAVADVGDESRGCGRRSLVCSVCQSSVGSSPSTEHCERVARVGRDAVRSSTSSRPRAAWPCRCRRASAWAAIDVERRAAAVRRMSSLSAVSDGRWPDL